MDGDRQQTDQRLSDIDGGLCQPSELSTRFFGIIWNGENDLKPTY